MRLGRKSFAERVFEQLKNQNVLKDRILKRGKEVLFVNENGDKINRSEFIEMIKTKNRSCDFIPVEWIDEIQAVLSGDSAKLEIHLSNWMRIRETNIWDHRTLIIQNGETEWAKQWLPWAGILWGRRIRKKGDTFDSRVKQCTFSQTCPYSFRSCIS